MSITAPLVAPVSSQRRELIPNPPTSGIGSQADNQAFLEWLKRHGDTAMIERGCCLCRVIGHSFERPCYL